MSTNTQVKKLLIRLAGLAVLALAAGLLAPKVAHVLVPTAAQASGQDIVNAAEKQLGATYCWDGGDTTGPTHGGGNGNGKADDCGEPSKVGFDCSGLVLYAVHKALGIALPHDSTKQASYGTNVTGQPLQPGDVLFFGGSSFASSEHVGIYVGPDRMIDANTAWWKYADGVQYRSISATENGSAGLHYDGAVRFVSPPATLPAEPSGPRVASTSWSSAALTWTDASNNETSFVTQYKIGNGHWNAGPSAGANTTSVTVPGLSPNTPYTFQVGARNEAGTHWSAYAYGRTSAPPAALAAEPANPRVASTSSSSAVLTWTDASNNETGFATQYKTGDGGWATGPSVGPNSTSVTVPGLSPNTPYTFQIGARNSAGTHWSAYAQGTTGAAASGTLPAQPANPRVTSMSSSSAVLTWTDASNNETGFATQYKIGNGGWTAGPSVGANATSVTVGGLSAGTAYTFQVGARNSVGTHWSAYATGTTSATTTPAPSGLNYQVTNYDNDGTTGVYLRNSSDVNDVIRDSAHFVTYGTTVTLLCGGFGSSVGPSSNTAWDDVRVADGRTGWISEHWLNTPVGSNQHVAGEPACGAPPVTLPAEPTNPRVTSTSTSSAVLAWTDASNNETDFVTQYKVGNGGWVAGPSVGANATSVTVGGLSAGTAYTFQVGARNSVGTHWSAYAYGTTSSAPAPTPTPTPTPTPALNYQVTNYDNDGTTGVYLRNSSNINDVIRDSAHFVPYGTTVTLVCGGFGSSVGPYSNTAWDYVRVSDGRTGWISEHWLNTPVSSNQHVPGEPNC